MIEKRKERANYIQQCVKSSKDYAASGRMHTLSWFQAPTADWDEQKLPNEQSRAMLDKHKKVSAKYNDISKENRGGFG